MMQIYDVLKEQDRLAGTTRQGQLKAALEKESANRLRKKRRRLINREAARKRASVLKKGMDDTKRACVSCVPNAHLRSLVVCSGRGQTLSWSTRRATTKVPATSAAPVSSAATFARSFAAAIRPVRCLPPTRTTLRAC